MDSGNDGDAEIDDGVMIVETATTTPMPTATATAMMTGKTSSLFVAEQVQPKIA